MEKFSLLVREWKHIAIWCESPAEPCTRYARGCKLSRLKQKIKENRIQLEFITKVPVTLKHHRASSSRHLIETPSQSPTANVAHLVGTFSARSSRQLAQLHNQHRIDCSTHQKKRKEKISSEKSERELTHSAIHTIPPCCSSFKILKKKSSHPKSNPFARV